MKRFKQKEFSFRNFDKLEGITKELTQFDDIVIPSVNGETPLSVDTMPGQTNNIDMSLLNDILRQIINATKVPPALVGLADNSYHTSASQENYKFSKHILRKQNDFSIDLTRMISKIYFMVNKTYLKYNRITFNPPMFAKLEQIAAMIGQAQAQVDFISGIYTDLQGNSKVPKSVITKRVASFLDLEYYETVAKKESMKDSINNEIQKLQNQNPSVDQQIAQDPTDPNNFQQ